MTATLLARSWVTNGRFQPKESDCKALDVTVVQFNTLANSLCSTDSFPKSPSDCLEWEYRKQYLAKEITDRNPNIVCLQEVDQYEYYRESLGAAYGSIYFPKLGGHDGTAIFYDQALFAKEEDKTIRFTDANGDQSQGVAMLRLKADNCQFWVVSTHLKAKEDFESVRVEQIKQLLNHVAEACKASNCHSVIFTGDLNTEPSGPVYDAIAKSDTGFVSAYSHYRAKEGEGLSKDTEPAYTTWKIRKETAKRVIDYIWYTENRGIDLVAWLSIPEEDNVGPNALPCHNYPSDHFALACKFRILTN